MSTEYTTYLGHYVKVHLPVLDSVDSRITCPKNDCANHGKKIAIGSFCSRCGTPLKSCNFPTERTMNINDFMESHLNEDDMFMVISPDQISVKGSTPFRLLLPNCQTHGGTVIDSYETGEYPLPDLSEDHFMDKDWKLLFTKLTENNIKFETKIGCISYSW